MIIPGSGPDGHWFVKLLNMLLCGVIFVTTAYWARQHTVTTQMTVTELMGIVKTYLVEGKLPVLPDPDEDTKSDDPEQGKQDEETVPLSTNNPTDTPPRHKLADNEI